MIAIGDEGEGDRIGDEVADQLERMGRGHVGVVAALQDGHGAMGADGRAEQEMVFSVLDQRVGEDIGLV